MTCNLGAFSDEEIEVLRLGYGPWLYEPTQLCWFQPRSIEHRRQLELRDTVKSRYIPKQNSRETPLFYFSLSHFSYFSRCWEKHLNDNESLSLHCYQENIGERSKLWQRNKNIGSRLTWKQTSSSVLLLLVVLRVWIHTVELTWTDQITRSDLSAVKTIIAMQNAT